MSALDHGGAGKLRPPGTEVVEYLPGRRLDVHRPAGSAGGGVLLWHGRGPNECDVLAPLAALIGRAGLTVFVPDWRADAADGGRADLLGSIAFVLAHASEFEVDVGRLVLTGWSRGATAAAAVALAEHPTHGWRPYAMVGLAGGYTRPDPIYGSVPASARIRGTGSVPFFLVHGVDDEVVPVSRSREFAALLTAQGRQVELTECPTDHAGVVMAEYDPSLGRCRPARSSAALAGGELSAVTIACAAAVRTR